MRLFTPRPIASFIASFLAYAALLAAPGTAMALQSDPQTTQYATVALVTATEATGKDAVLHAGLDLKLQPGWHAYWRMPGEGGLPPSFDWKASRNVKTVDVRWPVPRRFEQLGMYSFGYTDEIILPLDITLAEPSKAATLNAKADIMVCKDICIPQHIELSLPVPAGAAKPSPDAPRLADAVKAVPHDGNLPALRIDSAVIGPKALVVRAWSQSGFDGADLFVEVKDGAFYFTAPPKIETDAKDPRGATIAVTPPDGAGNMADALMHHTVTLTLVRGKVAIEKAIAF